MKKKIVSTLILATAVISFGAYAQQKSTEQLIITSEADLKWTVSRPGLMIAHLAGKSSEPGFFMHRSKFDANQVIQPHTHPINENISVVSGTFYIGQGEKVDESKAEGVKAGGVIVIPAGVPHFVIIKEETITHGSGVGPSATTFLGPKDDPQKK